MRRVALALVFVAFAACEEEPTPPTIGIDVSPVNLGVHLVDPDAGPYTFNLQLYNSGEEKLVIESVSYRGDMNCAFEFEGPDLLEMGENEASFVRGHYDPAVPADDQIAMEVASNASNFPLLIVPICARAVPEGVEDAGVPECQVPPEDQPDCEEP